MPPGPFLDAHHAYQRALLDLERGDDGFDLVHIHSLHYLPVAMAELLGLPTVLTLHTRRRRPGSSRRSCGRATPGCTSPPSRRDGAGRRRAVPAAEVITNGVDLGTGGRPVPAAPARCGAGGSCARRRRTSRSGPRASPACDTALASTVSDAAYFRDVVEPMLGRDAVHVGRLDHAALAAELGAAAVALMTPEWDEPFGLAAVEAMATGTPVAAFARGGLPAIVGPAAGRLVQQGDVPALADAALAAARLPRAGVRAHVRRSWGIDAMGLGYEAVYQRM